MNTMSRTPRGISDPVSCDFSLVPRDARHMVWDLGIFFFPLMPRFPESLSFLPPKIVSEICEKGRWTVSGLSQNKNK